MGSFLKFLPLLVEHLPALITIVSELTKSLKQTTAPDAVVGTGDSPVVKGPSETVKALQKLLNELLKPKTPLVEDGWLGPKTEAAIQQAMVMLKPYLAMLSK